MTDQEAREALAERARQIQRNRHNYVEYFVKQHPAARSSVVASNLWQDKQIAALQLQVEKLNEAIKVLTSKKRKQ